jgi:hypothetical protein
MKKQRKTSRLKGGNPGSEDALASDLEDGDAKPVNLQLADLSSPGCLSTAPHRCRLALLQQKKSAAMPFNKPLSVGQTTRKWSDRKTQRGCVTFDGRAVKIRIISTKYDKYAREYEYRFEVIDREDPSYKGVDFVWYKDLLSRNKCLLVRLNSDQGHPGIDQVLEELNPDDYRY